MDIGINGIDQSAVPQIARPVTIRAARTSYLIALNVISGCRWAAGLLSIALFR